MGNSAAERSCASGDCAYRATCRGGFQDRTARCRRAVGCQGLRKEGIVVNECRIIHVTVREARSSKAAGEDVGTRPDTRLRYPPRVLRRPAPASRGGALHRAGAQLVVPDEPIQRVDLLDQARWLDLLDAAKRQDLNYMFISHDLRVGRRCHADPDGEKEARCRDGRPREIFKSPKTATTAPCRGGLQSTKARLRLS